SLSALASSFNSANTTAAIGNAVLPPIENGQQIVRMAETNSGYSPNEFTIKKGVPVRWVIDAQAPYSCASSIIMSKFNIRKNLVAGENIIEFTPTETGRIDFSCSMGMYRGAFYVVDENSVGAPTAATSNKPSSAPKQIAGGGCGAGGSAGGGGCGGCGGGGTKFNPQTATTAVAETNPSTSEQVIKTTYEQGIDIKPNSFIVKAGLPVRLEIYAKDNASGCMGSIMVPGLYNTPEFLTAGQTIVMSFTPTKAGVYPITCAMGIPRGEIKVE
ncbi:MAG: cupredoxin domain-containing protein, partial [Patescibacteria group bacterium]